MFFAGADDEIDGFAEFGGAGLEALGLLQGDEGIGIAMDDVNRWESGVDVKEGGNLTTDDFPFGKVLGLGAEGVAKAFGRAAIVEILGGGAEVEEVGNGIKDGGGFNFVTAPINDVVKWKNKRKRHAKCHRITMAS